MKKIVAVALLSSVAVASSNAAVFNGYSFGINGGVVNSHNELKSNVPFLKGTAKKTHGVFGIQLDYDISRANDIYFGLGLDFAVYTGKSHKQLAKGPVAQNGYFLRGQTDFHSKPKWHSELDARIGYNFCNKGVLYALVGLKLFKLENKITTTSSIVGPNGLVVNGASVAKGDKTKLAPVVGAGTLFQISPTVSTGIEYRYSIDRKGTLKSNGVKIAKWEQDSHTVLARLRFHF